jgi:integrase/recombinase XerD
MNLDSYLQQHYTQKTAAAYGREIAIYLSNYPAAATADYQDITAYLGVLRGRYSKPATLNRILAGIKVYYDYLCATDVRTDHPAKSILLKDQRNRTVQVQDLFTSEELETLLHRRERYTALEPRNRVLISLLVYQALHPSEMAALTVNDIHLEAGTIQIRGTGKTKARELSLRPNQVLLFYQYIQDTRPKLLGSRRTNALLIGLRGEPMKGEDITKHVKRSYAGLYPGRVVSAQSIRQSVLTNLLKAGHDLSVVQGFAGHRYPGSTERYRPDEVATLAAAVQRYHPFG